MPASLLQEIQQTRPFASAGEEALLNLVRTARVAEDALDLTLRPSGISGAQYNVLRILRGAGSAGLGRNAIRDRLVGRMPDVTRLLDRLEEAGLVRRERDTDDRRCVPTFITRLGLALLDELDEPLAAMGQSLTGRLTDVQLRTLSDLLTAMRQRD
jgi:DNA-binding MarR family transcriptional regulator